MAIFFSNWLLLKVKNSWDIYINAVWFIKFFKNFIKINWADVFDIGIVDFLSRFQYTYTYVVLLFHHEIQAEYYQFQCFCCRRKSNRKSKSPEPYTGKVIVDVPSHPCDPVELRRQHYQTPGTHLFQWFFVYMQMSVITWKEFLKHVDVVYISELKEIKENNSMACWCWKCLNIIFGRSVSCLRYRHDKSSSNSNPYAPGTHRQSKSQW